MRKAIYLFLIPILYALFTFSALCEHPTEVVIEESELTIDLAVSDTYTLSAYVLPSEADQALNWYSAKNSTLSVKDGVLTAHRTGRITITANIPGNGKIKDHCVVTIIDSRVPASVTVTGEYTTLEPTEKLQLASSVEPSLADQSVTWQSLDERIAIVDQTGLVTAKREGTVYIRVYSNVNRSIKGTIKLTVRYKDAPDSLQLSETNVKMYTGESFTLKSEILPEDASRILNYSSSDASIASVDENGFVSCLQYGECVITVKSAADPSVRKSVSVRVLDKRIPDAIIAYPSSIEMAPPNTRIISLLVLPETLRADLVWRSTDEHVAQVDEHGRVTARNDGSCRIICESAYTSKISVSVPVTVESGKTPTALAFSASEITIKRGESAKVEILKKPADAGNAIVSEYSNPGIVRMDETGLITALRRGETTVRIYSYKKPEVSCDIRVIVEDALAPLSVVSDLPEKILLRPGEKITPSISFLPSDALQEYDFTCSNPEIAYVDASGAIVAVSPGVSTVRAQNSYANEVYFEFKVTVEAEQYTLVMPERRTDKAGIDQNMQKIESVRLSAQKMLYQDYENGKMDKKEYERRKTIVDNAFEMYAFPWMTESVRKYWMDSNSENGRKDFKPGIVYYGLPYVSGVNSARTFNVARAIEADRYILSEDGKFYIMNRESEDYTRLYAGNDCSSFISLACFQNTVHNGEPVKTYTLYYDDRFITTDDPASMKAGDIMVRHSIHVIMFLYWADDAHTQAVFIEQGGNEEGINTISTSVYTVSDYFGDFYHVRSLRF